MKTFPKWLQPTVITSLVITVISCLLHHQYKLAFAHLLTVAWVLITFRYVRLVETWMTLSQTWQTLFQSKLYVRKIVYLVPKEDADKPFKLSDFAVVYPELDCQEGS